MDRTRLTIQEAARRLGVSEGAIRKRVNRGTLEHYRDEDGRIYVYLDGATRGVDDVQDEVSDPHNDALTSALRDQVAFLRAELERRGEEGERYQRIIAGLAQSNADLSARIRELESPEASEEGAKSGADADEGTSPQPNVTGQPRVAHESEHTVVGRFRRWIRGERR